MGTKQNHFSQFYFFALPDNLIFSCKILINYPNVITFWSSQQKLKKINKIRTYTLIPCQQQKQKGISVITVPFYHKKNQKWISRHIMILQLKNQNKKKEKEEINSKKQIIH